MDCRKNVVCCSLFQYSGCNALLCCCYLQSQQDVQLTLTGKIIRVLVGDWDWRISILL